MLGVSHIQLVGCQPEKTLYTMANPAARGLLKTTKEKVWQHTLPPPRPTLIVRRSGTQFDAVKKPACLKKNQNAPRPSEHPPVRRGKMSKRLGGIKGCKYKISSWQTGSPTEITLEMAMFHTGGVFSYLPHHLDLALEDSVGHSTCMSVLARRRAIMGWLMGLG